MSMLLDLALHKFPAITEIGIEYIKTQAASRRLDRSQSQTEPNPPYKE